MPPHVRRRPGIVALRALGTLACIVGGITLVLAYVLLWFLYGLSQMTI